MRDVTEDPDHAGGLDFIEALPGKDGISFGAVLLRIEHLEPGLAIRIDACADLAALRMEDLALTAPVPRTGRAGDHGIERIESGGDPADVVCHDSYNFV